MKRPVCYEGPCLDSSLASDLLSTQQAISLCTVQTSNRVWAHIFIYHSLSMDSSWKLPPQFVFLLWYFIYLGIDIILSFSLLVPAYFIAPLITFYLCSSVDFIQSMYKTSDSIGWLWILFSLSQIGIILHTHFEINYPRIFFSLNTILNAMQCCISEISISLYVSPFFINYNMYFMWILCT